MIPKYKINASMIKILSVVSRRAYFESNFPLLLIVEPTFENIE